MKRTLSLLATLALAARATAAVHGDYVEARTASVFAGACHYNGEAVTEGRSAVMAWNLIGGDYDGVDLTGVRVMAAVAGDDNLAESTTARTSRITVDADTDARAAAAVAWVKSRCGAQLGRVTGVRRASVVFRHDAGTYTAAAAGFASLSVRPMPDAACCSQPHMVWYQPLMPIDGRRVGYTELATASAGEAAWQRADENSAFYGTFSK